MVQVAFQNNPVHTSDNLPAAEQTAPAFILTAADLSDKTLADFAGKRRALSISLNVDTGICAQSVRTFNERASSLDNMVVLCTFADLSFAQARFCGAEGLDKVVTLLSFRSNLAADYDTALTDSPLCDLTACMALVLDENNRVLYPGLVAEIASEPDYDAILTVL